MTMKPASFLLLVALLGAIVLVGVMAGQMPDASSPLFTAGQSYVLTWDCTVVADQGQAAQGCFSEVVTVNAIRPDGWLRITDDQGDTWHINPARLVGFKPAPVALKAAR